MDIWKELVLGHDMHWFIFNLLLIFSACNVKIDSGWHQYAASQRTQLIASFAGQSEHTLQTRWDAGGRLQSLNSVQNAQGSAQFNHDAAGRLSQIKRANGASIRYGYDALGRRISRTREAGGQKQETQWILDTARPYSEIVLERNRQNGGAWQETRYTHTPDGVGQLISEQRQGKTLHVYEDGQGSARLITDESGQIIETLDFDAFGNEEAGNPQESRHRYTGESYDSATGLYHLRARDYDPKTGRFISMDEHPGSQSIPLTLNKYLYGNADPVNHIDPSGNIFISITMPSFGNVVRITSVGRQALGLLDKLDKVLVMKQMVQAYNNMWSVFNGVDWQSGAKASRNDSGFIAALSDFDEAIAHLASRSWKIFSHPNVEKGMKEFIKGQLAKQKTSLLIFAPTPEIKINFPVRHIWIGKLSMSKTQTDIYVEIGVKSKQGGRMLGVGHTWGRKGVSKQWFRQDWHSSHGAGDLCFVETNASYHYHCPE